MPSHEFDFIQQYFVNKANYCHTHTVLPNGDDASVHDLTADKALVVSTDTAVIGVHWPDDFPLDRAGDRAICAALSDLAAMGAEPCWAWLSVVARNADDLSLMGQGVCDGLNRYHVELAGGDTVCADTCMLSITVAGVLKKGAAMRRDQAKVGDKVWLLGDVGLSSLGLSQWQSGNKEGEWVHYFEHITPQIEAGIKLCQLGVRCCIDVSDGVFQDASHLAHASNLSLKLELSQYPHWQMLCGKIGEDKAAQCILSGGEDYALLFTAPVDMQGLSEFGGICVGECVQGCGVQVQLDGQDIAVECSGYKHFE